MQLLLGLGPRTLVHTPRGLVTEVLNQLSDSKSGLFGMPYLSHDRSSSTRVDQSTPLSTEPPFVTDAHSSIVASSNRDHHASCIAEQPTDAVRCLSCHTSGAPLRRCSAIHVRGHIPRTSTCDVLDNASGPHPQKPALHAFPPC